MTDFANSISEVMQVSSCRKEYELGEAGISYKASYSKCPSPHPHLKQHTHKPGTWHRTAPTAFKLKSTCYHGIQSHHGPALLSPPATLLTHHSPLLQPQSHHTEHPSHTGPLAASANNTPLQNCAQHSRLSSNTTSGRFFLSLLGAPTAPRSFILTFSPPVKDICSFLALESHALFLW